MKTTTKFKIAGLIALLTTCSIISGISYNKYSDSYDVKLKKEISHMSESQLQNAIKECDTVLEQLQQIIDAENTNPEERFDARRAHKGIVLKRDSLQKRLEELQKKQDTIANYHDFSNER